MLACLSALPPTLVVKLAVPLLLGSAFHSSIDAVPLNGLAHLAHLNHLELSGHVAVGDVASLWQLTALRWLSMGCRRCTGSWRGLAALSRLEHLALTMDTDAESVADDFRPYQDLPAALATLTALTSLTLLSFHRLLPEDTIRSEHLLPLGKLQRLTLTCTVHSADDVAAALPALQQLTDLDVACIFINPAAVDWQHLCRLTALRTLDLTNCRIQQLPEALSQLTTLTRLAIAIDDLSGLAPLSSLQHLQCLTLRSCGLASVPEQLAALTELESLDLSRNSTMVGGGWQHLCRLRRLRELDLRDVPLPDGVPPEVAQLVAQLPALQVVYPHQQALPLQQPAPNLAPQHPAPGNAPSAYRAAPVLAAVVVFVLLRVL